MRNWLFASFIAINLAISAFEPEVFGVEDDVCASDLDCVNHREELGNTNFEILREIRDGYAEKIEFPVLLRVFREGGMKKVFSLLDPHSKYVTAGEWIAAERTRNLRGGIGIKIRMFEGKIRVVSLTPNGPAERSGKFRKGDHIIAVDNRSIGDADQNTVVGWIRGEIGTEVTLRLYREAPDTAEFSVTLRREFLELPNVISSIFGDIGYIRIGEFENGPASEIRVVLDNFSPNVRGLVLDLRGNPGGSLADANKVAAIFLERTALIVKLVRRNRTFQFFAGSSRSPQTEQNTLSMAVLVDEGTASAAEIVASALQDNGRAIIIGIPTFGKAIAQTMYGYYKEDEYWNDLLVGDYFSLTTGRLYRPNGRTLQGKGLIPDLMVEDGVGDDILQAMALRAFSEKNLPGHLKGEDEDIFEASEKSAFEFLRDDRQLYIAVSFLNIILRRSVQ